MARMANHLMLLAVQENQELMLRADRILILLYISRGVR